MRSDHKPNSVSAKSGCWSFIWACLHKQARAIYPPLCANYAGLLDLAPEWGLPGYPCYQRHRWSLTPPFHLFPSEDGCLLSVALAAPYGTLHFGGTLFYGVRTFLPQQMLRATNSPTSKFIILLYHPKIRKYYMRDMK